MQPHSASSSELQQQALVRNVSIWSKIKPDPRNPFFARRSTKNTPNTVVILLRNANVPMMQKNPPVFMPTCADQDFNIEPKPLAVNVLACSSTGLIHYIQIANEHLSLILPVYFITDGGQHPNKLPPLLRTFLESTTYTKVGFGAYEDAQRLKEQYGIHSKALLDIQWMTRIMGIGATNLGDLDPIFGDPHMPFIPGYVKDAFPSTSADTTAASATSTENRRRRPSSQGQPPVIENDNGLNIIDARRWDWEAHRDMYWTPELIRCVAQDAFITLSMLEAIQKQRFKLLPLKSFHHLVKKGKFLSEDLDNVERDAQAMAIMRHLVEQGLLESDKTDQQDKLQFSHPSVLNRRVQLPGTRPSVELMNSSRTRRLVAELFGCRSDELRLMQDSDWTRKPDKIQDLECFLGLYDWLELLPGALEPLDEGKAPSSSSECGRKPAALVGLYLNFGALAERMSQQPVETRKWALHRMNRLINQGVLVTCNPSGLVRIHPTILRRLKGLDVRPVSKVENSSKNKEVEVAL
ncbi:hypothetical protein BGW42_000798 [Actinomortierella wolfii]|nr:hypothetical protein BGW42_000798 [Actinomortierella wolfii]